MTFSEMLSLIEDYGPLTDGDPRDWGNDRKNGIEFLRKGIRDKHSVQDGIVVPEKKIKIARFSRKSSQ